METQQVSISPSSFLFSASAVLKGHDFSRAEDLRKVKVMSLGTTLVVPQAPQKSLRALAPAEPLSTRIRKPSGFSSKPS